MSEYYWSKEELYHHGILGQKWGKRNGPPYPLGEEDHSKNEKEEGWKKSLNGKTNEEMYDRKKKENKNTISKRTERYLKNTYHLSDAQMEQYKKTAKIIGVSLAATAGVLAVSYVLKNSKDNGSMIDPSISSSAYSSLVNEARDSINQGKVAVHQISGFNAGNLTTTSLLSNINKTDRVGDPVGYLADIHGYGICKNGEELLNSAASVGNYDSLVKDAIVNQRSNTWFSLDRRLSCWSGSHSYLLSMLTGKQYCSRNYQNLVEFNDFGNLYNSKMKIVDLFGKPASNFVGDFGVDKGSKIDKSDAYKLIDTIYDNFKTPNAKNGSIVGFIDAAYRKNTCTHQWNFEINKNGVMNIIDTWSGEKYEIARKLSDGKIKYNDYHISVNKNKVGTDASSFLTELYHYNRESFRMYSPSLDDLNMDAMAKIVLAKKK